MKPNELGVLGETIVISILRGMGFSQVDRTPASGSLSSKGDIVIRDDEGIIRLEVKTTIRNPRLASSRSRRSVRRYGGQIHPTVLLISGETICWHHADCVRNGGGCRPIYEAIMWVRLETRKWMKVTAGSCLSEVLNLNKKEV
ncbi:MAG: hypothetical protein QW734_05075 [Candidatus Bathyarchaeia archaeon]